MNYLRHFWLVCRHRWYVFKLSIKAGIPFRGFVHDLSKFSFTEFFPSGKYYVGNKSPIKVMRDEFGYSKVWLHHKALNKHHFEYWEDITNNKRIGVFVPYKYIVESICDKIAAGMVYKGREWNQNEPYEYWNNVLRDNIVVKHPGSVEFVDIVFKKISDDGVNEGLKPKYLKRVYKDMCDKYDIK